MHRASYRYRVHAITFSQLQLLLLVRRLLQQSVSIQPARTQHDHYVPELPKTVSFEQRVSVKKRLKVNKLYLHSDTLTLRSSRATPVLPPAPLPSHLPSPAAASTHFNLAICLGFGRRGSGAWLKNRSPFPHKRAVNMLVVLSPAKTLTVKRAADQR